MSASIERLAGTVPSWFMFPSRRGDRLYGFAAPAGTVFADGIIELEIAPVGSGATVAEAYPRRLPAWCPELHLNGDRTFCLGLDRTRVGNKAEAEQWWADLQVHLRLLSVAIRTRVWPSHSALDHGEAGGYHREALRLAERLRLVEDYAQARIGEPSWIGIDGNALIDADGGLLNADALCPCGGSVSHSRRRCGRRREIKQLVLLERARRLALLDFWRQVGAIGRTCCGRMRDCPLAIAHAPNPEADQLLARTRRALRSRTRI